LENDFPRLDLFKIQNLEFEKPDTAKFSCLLLAYESLKKGGNMSCILNAANEIAVQKFISGETSFVSIPEIISETMNKASFIKDPSIEDLFKSDEEARKIAKNIK
jgi:1-deoxy-D-xylulose-5-phosphate reductoisomerase